MMKRISKYIILPLLLAGVTVSAQEPVELSQVDSIVIANPFKVKANGNIMRDAAVFQQSPEVDIAKALYGQFSGLLVEQGTGRSEINQSSLELRGHAPLVLIDGYPRELSDITSVEIESITVLKDAVSAAIYGVKGGNGVIMITTKRGQATPLKVSAKYQFGLSTAFRAPDFSSSYTYALKVNEARALDGLAPMYGNDAFTYFANGERPYAYPDVDWMSKIYRKHGDNHRAQLTFTGGNRNFRYFAAVDYMKDNSLYVKPSSDDRYNANTYDNRLGIRANVDVNVTESTSMKLGVMARLSEFNRPYWENISGDSIEETLYKTPAAAFPVKHIDGTYGGSRLYGANNPVALHQDSGNHLYSETRVLADMVLRQDLGMFIKGLSADASVAFDYTGEMTETSYKTYRYGESVNPVPGSALTYYGTDSKTMSYSHYFHSLGMRSEFQARLNWERDFGKHHIDVHAAYRQRSYIFNQRNASAKTQEVLGTASYSWNDRLFADLAVNWSGSAYLPAGQRFNIYPALSVAYVVSKEPYVKAYGSIGMSGYDGNMEHELFLQTYGSSNASGYRFGENANSYSGRAEGDIPATVLDPEKSSRATLGFDIAFFSNRLSFNAEAFAERRTNILISPSNISGVIGIGVMDQSMGENKYKGLDLSLAWNDKAGDFSYGAYANGGWLLTEVVNDGQAYQRYDYLYHAGNPIGQRYGLEVIGIFQNQYEINNSPKQTFSDVRPGDLKYKDQNGDGVVNDEDVVKMFGSTTPLFQFGFGLHAGWKGLKVYADFQGVTGVTVNLLDSPLYQPLVNNGTISNNFLAREVTWTPETAATATMPRLTTLENANNYRKNSLWYRDGSFIKLRNLGVSYTIPKKVARFSDITVSLNGTNLFSLDNIKFADPEQLEAAYPSTRVFWAGLKFNF